MLKIAIQKSGELNKVTLNFFKDCNFELPQIDGQEKVTCLNYPIELIFLEEDDLLYFGVRGLADTAIMGVDLYKEIVLIASSPRLSRERNMLVQDFFYRIKRSKFLKQNNSSGSIYDMIMARTLTD